MRRTNGCSRAAVSFCSQSSLVQRLAPAGDPTDSPDGTDRSGHSLRPAVPACTSTSHPSQGLRMSYKIRLAAAAIALAASSVFASDAHAQQAPQPDSATHRRPAVVSRASNESIFSRIWNMQERRYEVIRLMHENRMLAEELRRHDKHIAKLEVRLDSLRAVELEKQRQIATIDSLTAATRAQRLELEARVRAMEETVAKKGRL